MNISIRMIGIATTFFWIFIIIFAATAAYSAKDLQFNFGDPVTSMTTDNQMIFSMPINIVNRGLYNIGYFNITSKITDSNDVEIVHNSTVVPVIRKGEEITVYHDLAMNVTSMLQRYQDYLFNDSELRVYESVGLRLAEVIPVQASGNFTVPWGAPLYNLAVGTPQFTPVNLTHFRVSVPISFENHAFFDLSGNLHVRMYSSSGALIGQGETVIDAPQHSQYSGSVEPYILMNQITPTPTNPTGYFTFTIQTPLFTYESGRISYG